jgi:hypothetical protein
MTALLTRRTYRYHNTALECILHRDGILDRFLIVDSARLRAILARPRREAIEPLSCRQGTRELRTSELWEQAQHQALPRLQSVYAEADLVRTLAAAQESARKARARALATQIAAEDLHGEARGILLHSGGNELYLWDSEALKLLRIRDPAIGRALMDSRARPGETIHVQREREPAVPIEEAREGSHGSGRRTLHHRPEESVRIFRVPSPIIVGRDPSGRRESRAERDPHAA